VNSKQALTQARKRWGKKAVVEKTGTEHSPESRAAAFQQRNEIPDIKENRKARDALLFKSCGYQYKVGVIVMGLFFEVKGHGDTWVEAFADADKTAQRSAA